jgi:3-hydroxy-9,10-secoandrosta-1,3,5(10)-triene-9,17-dione monooxygenase
MTKPTREQEAQYQHAEAETRATLVARATDLRPVLSKNALQTEKDRRVVEENIVAMAEAGLFRTMVPKRYGGHQGSIRTHLEVTAAVAEACGSSAWVLALTNVCAWFTGLFDERAQDDVFRATPDARVAGVFSPSTQVQRVEGGLVASGKWFWSSGCLHADWAMLGLLEQDKNGVTVDQYLALMPMSELTIEDTWFTAGMRGTGSNCVVAKDVFVPDHRLLPLMKAVEGDYPTPFTDEAAYRAAFVPVAALILIGAQLGMSRAALAHVIEKAPQRAIAYTSFKKQTDSTAFQIQVAKAAMKVDTAHLHAFRAADDIDRAALSGEYLDYKTRARVRADTGYVAQYATDAINMLMTAHGAGSFADASPMQRIWRDSNTAARHAIVLQPVGEEIYGKALLGAENTVTPLV